MTVFFKALKLFQCFIIDEQSFYLNLFHDNSLPLKDRIVWSYISFYYSINMTGMKQSPIVANHVAVDIPFIYSVSFLKSKTDCMKNVHRLCKIQLECYLLRSKKHGKY